MKTYELLTGRLDLLTPVQKWSRINNHLSAGQRICLSQERAAIMQCLAILKEEPSADPKPRYVLPRQLNEKVLHLYGVMQQRWRADPKSMIDYL